MTQITHTPPSLPTPQPLKFKRFLLLFLLTLISTTLTLITLSPASPNASLMQPPTAAAMSGGNNGLHGLKWHDLNGNGLKENDEPTLEGWQIILEGEGKFSAPPPMLMDITGLWTSPQAHTPLKK